MNAAQRNGYPILTLLLALCLPLLVAAETDPARVAVKLKLLGNLVSDSPAAQRIESSEHSTESQARLKAARAAHDEARQLLDQGLTAEAEARIDAGLRAFSNAARNVSDHERQNNQARRQYQERLERIDSFREALARVVADKGASVGLDPALLDRRLERAEQLHGEARYPEASRELELALGELEQALTAARDQETLVYTTEFASPQEAYDYELERNRSHAMLVELMLSRQEIAAPTRTMIEQFVERNSTARSQAETLAGEGQPEAALEVLEQGTEHLIRALRLAGVPL
ncbi:MAG: hypothetical protein R3202_09935 [Candidatus Competibacterales bacterium]|nr:hypothetical protein [Candidatus Competibacterales bacterium]